MADVDTSYGTPTGVTVTLTSLANGSSRQSAAWDFQTGNAIDIFVLCETNGQASGTGYMFVHVYGGLAASAPYTDGASGSDAAFTTANIKNAPILGTICMNETTAVVAGPFSIASAFNGLLPPGGGLIFNNESGAALSATGGDHDIDYLPVFVSSN